MSVHAPLKHAAVWDLNTFFIDFYPTIHRFVSIASGGPPDEVDDLVQETLLAAWRQRETFRAESSPDTWILSIARNRVRQRYRKEGRQKEIRDALAALASLESDEIPERVLQARETGRRVRAALGQLEPGYAEVLILKYLDDQKVARIAEKLGETEKAIEGRLLRAREELRMLLKGTPHDPES